MNTEFKVTPLKVVGTDLTDADGDKVQLKGISSHALALYPQYVNEDSLRTLRDEWHANVFRLAMYTMEDGGYCNGGDQKKLEQSIDTAVKACQKLDMYVIIDWHILSDGNPLTHEKEAEVFLRRCRRNMPESLMSYMRYAMSRTIQIGRLRSSLMRTISFR